MILDRIKGPEDVRRLTYKQTEILAEEIRRFLIETTSRTGGHLASNLGVVDQPDRRPSGLQSGRGRADHCPVQGI